MQWGDVFALDFSNLVFILESFFCPIGCPAGIFSEEKISQFWLLTQFKIKFVVLSKASTKKIGPKCIFLDALFCLDAEELKTSLLLKLEC